jgi:hypothetical protein
MRKTGRLARKLLNMIGRTLSNGCCMNWKSMTETVCSRYWSEKFEFKARAQLINSLVWFSVCVSQYLSGRLMAMLVHVGVCWLLELKRTWSCRIRKFGRPQWIWVRRTETVFIPQVCCVLLLGNSVSLRSGLLGDRTPRLSGDRRIWVWLWLVHRRGREGVRQVCSVQANVCQVHSWQAFLQQAESYFLLKGWNPSYRWSLLCGQAADIASSATVELPRETQTCIWTGGHAVELNCRVVGEVVEFV